MHASVTRLTAHLGIPLYRNGYALMLNSVITSALGMGYWIVAARNYTTATVGLNSAVISAMMFLAGVAQLNLASAELRFIPGAGRATGRFVAFAYLISVIIAAVISVVFLRGLNIWASTLGAFGASPLLAAWFIVSTMGWCLFVLQDSALTGLRQAIWVPIENTVFSVAKIVLLVGLARPIPQYGLFASWTIGMAITLLPVNALIFRRLIPRHIEQSTGNVAPLIPVQVMQYVAADYLGGLCWLASTTFLPLMITEQAGASANAYFFLSWQIASMLFLVSSNLSASLIVEAVNDPAKLHVYSYRIFIQMARIVVPMAVIIVGGAPYILRVFGNNYATEAVLPLRLLVLSAIPFMINSLYASVARVRRHMRAVLMLQMVSCVLVLSLSHILLGIYGIWGVGLAWLVSQTLMSVVLLLTTELRSFRRWSGQETRRNEKPTTDGSGAVVSREACPVQQGLPDGMACHRRFAIRGLKGIDVQKTDWLLRAVAGLGLLRLPHLLRKYGASRRGLALATEQLSRILPTDTRLQGTPPLPTWIAYRSITTVTDVIVVSVGPVGQPPSALLKLAKTQPAAMNLWRQQEILADLHADSRLGEWRALLPTLLAANVSDGGAYLVEQMLPGRDARHALTHPETRAKMQQVAAATIRALHVRTARSVVVGAQMLDLWIDEPIRVVRQSRVVRSCTFGTDQAIERLAKELHAAFIGRTVVVSWIHGDFAPGNILMSPDAGTVTGIVDWDQAVPDGLPLLDLLLLLLSVRTVAERREMGDVVRALLNGSGWAPHEQALIDTARTALPGDTVELKSMVLLCWLRHVRANLITATLASGRLWARQNIEPVLRCL